MPKVDSNSLDKFIYKNIKDLADRIISQSRNKKMVYAVLFYDEASALVKELLKQEDVCISYIDICDPTINGYDKEYYVILTEELELCAEEAYFETNDRKGYLGFDADVLYIDGRANSRITIDNDIGLCFEIEKRSDEAINTNDQKCSDNCSQYNSNRCCSAYISKDHSPDGEIYYNVNGGDFVIKFNNEK